MTESGARKGTFGWCMYDWANSAYTTTVAVGLLPAYFAQAVVGLEGVRLGDTLYRATTLWGFTAGLAAFLAFLLSPTLGAVADMTASKKRFLLACAYTGSLFTVLLYFCQSGDVFKTLFFFLIAQVAYVGGNVFYDAFLPRIAPGQNAMDRLSGKGYAYGYVGGGLQFALALGLVAGHRRLGMAQGLAARLGMVMAGLWWAGFTLVTGRHLSEAPGRQVPVLGQSARSQWIALLAAGFSRTLQTARQVRRYRHLATFLLAYMFYNDGIQTAINMATIYGKDELGLSTTALMVTLLTIQIVATAGALLFSRVALWMGTRQAVMLTLVIWSAVAVVAYFIQNAREFFALGVVVGLVLGGSQALSRSLYGSMIPPQASAEFYGFYTLFSKFSSIWGPWVFAAITLMAGSARTAILSLVAFFLVGLVLLALVDEEKARQAGREDEATGTEQGQGLDKIGN